MSLTMKLVRSTPGRAMPGTGYRGDPGLFGFLGKVGKGIAGAASGFVQGGPLGAFGGAVRGFKRGGKPPRVLPRPLGFAGRPMQPFQGGAPTPTPGFRGFRERLFPGGATGFESVNGGPPGTGYRLNKSDYFVKADPMDPNSPGVFIPEGTRWVKIRHRNPLNPRALSKAIGRVGSAKKATTMLGRITIRKAC